MNWLSQRGYRDKDGVISFVDRRVSMELAETAKESLCNIHQDASCQNWLCLDMERLSSMLMMISVYADDDLCLHLYSINGKHLNSCESSGRLNCIEWYSGTGKIITSLTVTQEECVLAGTKDGSLLVYSIENPQLRRISGSRSMKSKAIGT
ncbi:BEACH domain-containing protein B isoform X1 [Tanacetum coccineum]